MIALPTETVYGLAADARNAQACRAIFRAKRRPASDPLIVHVLGQRQARELAHWNPCASVLTRAFWPGPLTVVVRRREVVPDVVTAGGDSVALRSPSNRWFRAILRAAGRPLAAPSANPFGYVSPTTAAHVLDGLAGRIDAVFDGGPCRHGLESTIIDVTDPARPSLLRPGAIPAARIEEVMGVRLARPRRGGAPAPGRMPWHYSPTTPLLLVSPRALLRAAAAGAPGDVVLFPVPVAGTTLAARVEVLAPDARPETAARRLYGLLRRFDRSGARRILTSLYPGGADAEAINDRLRKAAARTSFPVAK